MGIFKNLLTASALLVVLNGCAVLFDPEPYVLEECEEPDYYQIDSYVYVPLEVRELIAGYVDGYCMPEIEMYGPEIYPDEGDIDYENLPSYIKADFNGDGYADYAYMFSRISWSGDSWFLKTKMMVVVSDLNGYSLCADYNLGTVSFQRDVPVEEYWGIRLLKRGTHTITISDKSSSQKVSFFLENDGIYLGSIEQQERSVFYVEGKTLCEFALDMGAVAKRKVFSPEERQGRLILLKR